MIVTLFAALFGPGPGLTLIRNSFFETVIEQRYEESGLPSAVLETMKLSTPSTTYLRLTMSGSTLIEHLQPSRGIEKICLDSVDRVLVARSKSEATRSPVLPHLK